jgi:hypothetical protein
MGNILLDNWILERASQEYVMFNDLSNNTMAFEELINALTLWDRVFYIKNDISQVWFDRLSQTKLVSLIQPICPNDCDVETARDLATEFVRMHPTISSKTVEVRALEYFYLSNILGMNYLPAYERSVFFQRVLIKNLHSRNLMMDYVDNTIVEYFTRINENLKYPLFECSLPVLYDYIVVGCKSLDDVIDKVIDLRKNLELINFRKWLDFVQECINKRDLVSFEYGMLQVKQSIEKITDKNLLKKSGYSISITAMPSLNIPIDNLLNRIHQNSQLLFIRSLAKHAIRNSRIQ